MLILHGYPLTNGGGSDPLLRSTQVLDDKSTATLKSMQDKARADMRINNEDVCHPDKYSTVHFIEHEWRQGKCVRCGTPRPR